MSIKVLKPGLATSVQDAGREGHYHLGIPPSGALDQYALRAANLLVGNAPTAAVLECALLVRSWSSSATPWWPCAGAHDAWRARRCRWILPSGFAPARYWGSTSSVPAPVAISPSTAASRYPRCWAAVRPTVWGRSVACRDGDWRRATCPWGLPRLCRGGLGAAALVAGGGRWRGELAGGSRALRPSPDPDAVERFFAETWTVGSEADRTGYRFKGGTALRFEPREQPFGAGSTRPTSSTPAIPSARSRYRAGSNPSSCIVMRCPVGICHAGHGDQPRPEPAGADAPNQKARFVAVSLEEGLEARRRYRQVQRLQHLPALSRRYRPLPSAKRPPAHL